MQSLKILLADDDDEDRFIMKTALTEIGHSDIMYFVEDGEKVLDFLSKNTFNIYPELIVLDLNMPKLNGTETLLLIKSNPTYKHIPVVIFSTSDNETEKQECLMMGAHSYIVKPMSYRESIDVAHYFIKQISAPGASV